MTRHLRKAIVSSDLGGELFLYDGEGDAVHVLNPSAGIILRGYLQGQTVEKIARALRRTYAVDPDRDLSGEILRFIGRIERKRLVVP
ncbi:MAG TPA: PqqD family protein [Terriglobales bacterium]|nr:PqqD family protein [Terriglobales bacterium]